MLKKCYNIFFLIVILNFYNPIFSQVYKINGNVSTQIIPVKNAEIKFIDVNDTTKRYSALTDSLGNYQLNLITKVHEPEAALPTKFELAQNYPNPFTTSTAISYKLNKQSDVQVTIYDILGREIKKYNIGEQPIGVHRVMWDGSNNFGKKVTAGIYFYHLQAGGENQTKKLLFVGKTNAFNLPIFQTVFFFSKDMNVETHQNSLQIRTDGLSGQFEIHIKNEDRTQPKIYNEVYENILIQNDTTLNFTLEAVGPWVKVKRGLECLLQDIDFPDSINGWTVGMIAGSIPKGIILHSNDEGESWHEQTCPIDEYLRAVDFIDNKNGWICSWHSILKTTDGGENWAIKYNEDLGTTGYLHDIQFLDDSTGFAVGGKGTLGFNGILLKTTDAGETWYDITPLNISTLTHISIVNEQNVWICGFDGAILFSDDLGLIWTNKWQNPSLFSRFLSIQFLDRYNGYAGCDDNEPFGFFRTTDGGNTWMQGTHELYLSLGIQTFFFVDSLNGWLAPVIGGGSWSMINTIDGGEAWNVLPQGTRLNNIKSICFINKDTGWAVGVEPIDTRPKSVILRYKTTKQQETNMEVDYDNKN